MAAAIVGPRAMEHLELPTSCSRLGARSHRRDRPARRDHQRLR